MKMRSASSNRSLACCLSLAFLSLQVTASLGDTTNAPARWPALTNVMHRWNAVSLEAVQQAAEGGELTAQHYLGVIYSNGERVPKNATNAIRWFERAGSAGYAPSYSQLGGLYNRGELVPLDKAKTVEYYRRAAIAGYPQAQANLAFHYRDGTGVAKNDSEALNWFRQAATNGHVGAFVEIGRYYRFGRGVPRDASLAADWFKRAAEKGHTLAELNLALLYEEQGNRTEALKFFQLAAEHGDTEAMFELHRIYEEGAGVPKDRSAADRWLIKSAEADNRRAQAALGYHHRYPSAGSGNRVGDGPASIVEAIKWYRRAADAGSSVAQYHLAECYLEAEGVELDEVRGLELMRAASDGGYRTATMELVKLYSRGIGEPRHRGDFPLELLQRVTTNKSESAMEAVHSAYDQIVARHRFGGGTPRDLVMAADWYCRGELAGVYDSSLRDKADYVAPPQGHGVIMNSLPGRNGIMAIGRWNTAEADEKFARVLQLYVKSARSNERESPLKIGEMYLLGRDVPQSPAKAWVWFSVAAERGNSEAKNSLAKLQEKLTPEDLQAAKNELSQLLGRLREVATTLR
jgi:TPR repeat protein